jgi:hypothetical protein
MERNPMTMSKIRLLVPLFGLLAGGALQGCGNSPGVSNGVSGSGGSISSGTGGVGGSIGSAGGNSGRAGAGGNPVATPPKVTIVGSGS